MSENPFDYVSYTMQNRAWKRGHAAGKVEGWNEALEAVLDLRVWNDTLKLSDAVEALRKKVSE